MLYNSKYFQNILKIVKFVLSSQPINIQFMFKELDIRKFTIKLKATIQSSGKLNFAEETSRALGLTEDTYMRFGIDDEDGSIYYLVILQERDDNSFKINKSGIYYYLPGKLLFDSLGLNYAKNPIIFDLIRMSEIDQIAGGEVYKLIKRQPLRKKVL